MSLEGVKIDLKWHRKSTSPAVNLDDWILLWASAAARGMQDISLIKGSTGKQTSYDLLS